MCVSVSASFCCECLCVRYVNFALRCATLRYAMLRCSRISVPERGPRQFSLKIASQWSKGRIGQGVPKTGELGAGVPPHPCIAPAPGLPRLVSLRLSPVVSHGGLTFRITLPTPFDAVRVGVPSPARAVAHRRKQTTNGGLISSPYDWGQFGRNRSSAAASGPRAPKLGRCQAKSDHMLRAGCVCQRMWPGVDQLRAGLCRTRPDSGRDLLRIGELLLMPADLGPMCRQNTNVWPGTGQIWAQFGRRRNDHDLGTLFGQRS